MELEMQVSGKVLHVHCTDDNCQSIHANGVYENPFDWMMWANDLFCSSIDDGAVRLEVDNLSMTASVHGLGQNLGSSIPGECALKLTIAHMKP